MSSITPNIKAIMAPKDEEWTPKFVRPPEKNPEGRTYFDWNDEKLLKWKANAIKMQEAHVSDNNRTEWFAYKPEERDAIELRILIAVYGLRIPQDGTKGIPSCPLKTYTRDERLHARKIKKVIVKKSDSSEKIHFNVIYISTATKQKARDKVLASEEPEDRHEFLASEEPEDKDEFFASEEPVFVVGKCRKFVDKDGKAYADFKEYKENNNLPKGPMLFPQNGSYTPEEDGTNGDGASDRRVPMGSGETPESSVFKRIKAVIDTVVMVGGMALAVAGVVTCFTPTPFSAMASAVMQAGSFLLTSYSTTGAIYGIYDKTSRDESIRTEVFLLISSALSSYTGFLRMKVGQYAREGKTYTEVLNKITRTQKNLFAAFNLITLVSSASTVLSSFVDLWNKKERTWLDYYHVCMGLFMFVNVFTKPKTIQGLFESEQLQYLNQIKDNLGSEEAKKEMSSMANQHSTSDQKAYLIRNLNRIEKPTEFFELINKTVSIVSCTSDGLIINEALPISPERYNEIGKSVFEDKLAQNTRYQETALHKSLLGQFFGGDYPSGRENELEERLNGITKLPVEERKEAMKRLVEEFSNGASTTGLAFDTSWDTADKACKNDMDKQINKLINNLKQGSNKTEQQKADFDKLKDLATKKINGIITSEEKQELQQQIDQCSRHRKQHFFQSSANHRNDANYDETMNTLEKEVAGGKNLEEWKMAQCDLKNAYPKESDQNAEYKQQKAEIDKGIKQAEYVRDFRSKADAFVEPTSDSADGSKLKQTFIGECQKAFEEARKTGDADAIANAHEKLRIAQEIDAKLDANVLETTQSFKRDIYTFTNAQNERLCYYVDIDKVKSDLQHIYEHPNVEDITVDGKKIYANMKIDEYDRLHRVLKQYRPNGKEFMIAASKIAGHPTFAEHVNTAQDIASITEAIDKHMGNPDESRRQEYLNNLASGTGDDHYNFCEAFSEKLEDVKALSPSIRSQWSRLLSMGYHGWTHEDDIAIKNVTMAEYFTQYANNLFTTENMTAQVHTQSGDVRETYMQSFGKRIQVGFTVGRNQTRISFFGKADTR